MRERITKLLRRLEWSSTQCKPGGIWGPSCPSCRNFANDFRGRKVGKHTPDCELKACLDMLAKAEESKS